ncbi:hypothetical protein DFH27DRAFT_343145 [Peziza echinospora]|nr:hypothetical protein DFH27DRAFT_343145 [Peziza echinospora]
MKHGMKKHGPSQAMVLRWFTMGDGLYGEKTTGEALCNWFNDNYYDCGYRDSVDCEDSRITLEVNMFERAHFYKMEGLCKFSLRKIQTILKNIKESDLMKFFFRELCMFLVRILEDLYDVGKKVQKKVSLDRTFFDDPTWKQCIALLYTIKTFSAWAHRYVASCNRYTELIKTEPFNKMKSWAELDIFLYRPTLFQLTGHASDPGVRPFMEIYEGLIEPEDGDFSYSIRRNDEGCIIGKTERKNGIFRVNWEWIEEDEFLKEDKVEEMIPPEH